jgi:beta-lactamase regulating signal transducer with metallopeptidase domain
MSLPHVLSGPGLTVLRALWEMTWQGALWALAVWALIRALPRLPASLRTTLWWLVALKCLVGLLVTTPVRLPLLPAPQAQPSVTQAAALPVPTESPAVAAREGQAVPVTPSVERGASRLGWELFGLGALLVWLAGLAWQARGMLQGLVQLRHLRREATQLEDAALTRAAEDIAQALGLSRLPRLRVSEHATSPLALGLLRPEVLLPRKALETLSSQELRMALAHELAHLRRGDLWLGWVPALAQALFFFHPLVRRACREYALAREEACDAAALQATGAAPREYGRLLLRFGVTRSPAAAAPGASSHLAALKRRIAMLEHAAVDSQPRRSWTRWTLGGLALAALVPFQVVAREALVTPVTPAVPSVPVVQPAPAVPATPPVVAQAPTPVRPATAPLAPMAPARPVAGPMLAMTMDSDFSYVLLQDEDSATMAGSKEDLKRARRLSGGTTPFFYVEYNDKEYVIRHPDTLKALGAAFQPQPDLTRQHEEFGQKMGALGMKMQELGVRQGELGVRQGEIGVKLAALGLKQSKAALAQSRGAAQNEKESPEIARQLAQYEQEEAELERQQEALEKEQDVLEKEQDVLEDEQEVLEKEHEMVERKQEAFEREAEKKVRQLVEDAVRKGIAEPVNR